MTAQSTGPLLTPPRQADKTKSYCRSQDRKLLPAGKSFNGEVRALWSLRRSNPYPIRSEFASRISYRVRWKRSPSWSLWYEFRTRQEPPEGTALVIGDGERQICRKIATTHFIRVPSRTFKRLRGHAAALKFASTVMSHSFSSHSG